MKLRNAKVLARCDDAGRPRAEGNRVEIRYKPRDGRAYHAGVRNLKPLDGAKLFPDEHCGPAEAAPPSGAAKRGKASQSAKKKASEGAAGPPPHEPGAIIVYADGACSGNPGPSGSGAIVLDGDDKHLLSEYLGKGTNNIAELTAILRAAERLAGRREPVRIYTDSKYAIGVLTKGWKAKKNPELIARTKQALAAFDDVEIYYVPGHAGIELNEVADQLARRAVERREGEGWMSA